MTVCFSSVVKGERYEKEFSYLEEKLKPLPIKKFTPETFNFLDKINSLEKLFKNYTTVISIDTDHSVANKVVTSALLDLPEGIYVRHYSNKLAKDISEDFIFNGYFEKIEEVFGKHRIKYIDESIIVFNFKDHKTVSNFFNKWKYVNLVMKDNLPTRKYDNNIGALEGCLISLAAEESGIKVDDTKLKSFFKQFEHYGPTSGHTVKISSSLV